MKKIYLLIAGTCLSLTLMAQSPGGVNTGLSLWLKADAAGTLNLSGSNVNSWTYSNNGANSFSFTGGTPGAFLSNAINSLPGIGFNGTEMDGPTGVNAPLAAGSVAYSVFAVWSSAITGTPGGPYQRVWTQWGNNSIDGNGTSLWLYNGLWGDQPEISVGGFTSGEGRTYTTNTFFISQMNLLNQASNDLELVDNLNLATAPTVLSTESGSGNTVRANLSAAINSLGYRQGPPGEFFNGTLSELIVYSNSISAGAQRNQIFSYLSMKYGIPVGVNLVSSGGATIWDASLNSTYNNSVFGLALDNGSGLTVQQSASSATAGVSGAGNIVLTEPAPFVTDQSFLMVGNDAGAMTEESSNMPATVGAGAMRLTRNWKVANASNNVGPVNLDFDFTGVAVSGSIGTPTDFRLIVNESGDPTFASGVTDYYTPTSFSSNVAHFDAVRLNDGATFAVISNSGTGTPLPVDFVSFTAQPDGGNVNLNWVVGDNQQASTYEIDGSSDGVHFAKIAVVPNDANVTSYGYVDVNAGPGTHYYRVLETDLDGESIYSKVVTASIGAGDFSVKVLNNPAAGRTGAELQINAVSAGKAFVELWSVGGARISLLEQAVGVGPNTISIPMSNLPAGSYVVKVVVNNTTRTVQVVKM